MYRLSELTGKVLLSDICRDEKGQYVIGNCPECGVEKRFVLSRGKPIIKRCYSCAGKLSRRHRDTSKIGSKYIDNKGYVKMYMPPDHPLKAMRPKPGYIQEHRLVMAEHLGRPLSPKEVVHHINGDKQDNRLSNLILTDNQHHTASHREDVEDAFREGYRRGYRECARAKQDTLQKEIRLLRWQVGDLSQALQEKLLIS